MKSISFLAIVSSAFVVGCGSEEKESTDKKKADADGGKPAAAAAQSFDTPEAVFAAFSQATANNDWQSAIGMITDESKAMVVMGMIFQAGFMTMDDEAKGKELEQIGKKYGLDENMPEPASPDDVDVNSLVDDLPGFIGELSAWIAANDTDSKGGFPKLTEVSDIKIDGDSATGLVKTEDGQQPIEFRKVDGQWKVHMATGPPPAPSIDELGVDFANVGEGEIGSMQVGDKTAALRHAFAYHAKFFDDPCIVLTLTAVEVSAEKQQDLEQQLKENPDNAFFFPDGPNVRLTLTPEGQLMSMNAWIDNSSINTNRGPAVDVQIDGNKISGRVGMAPKEFGEQEFQFHAKFDTEIRF